MTLRIDGQYSARPASAVVMNGAFDAPAAPPTPAAPQTARPTTSSVQKKTTAAQAAQTRADKAQRSLSTSTDRTNIEYLASARRDAAEAWSEVNREVKQLYAPAPAVVAKPPYATSSGSTATTPPTQSAEAAFLDLLNSGAPKASPGQAAAIAQVASIDTTTASLQSGSPDPRYQKIVMTAQAEAAAQARKVLQAQNQTREVVKATERAQAQELVGRAAVSNTPLQTLSKLGKDLAPTASADTVQAWQTELLCGGDPELQAAFRAGGVTGTMTTLTTKVERAASPSEAAALVSKSRALLFAAGNDLAAVAKDADMDNSQYRPSFDAKVAQMARIYEKLGTSPENGTTASKELVVLATTQGIGDNVRAYDEALARSALKDGNKQLTLDSITYLKNCGKPERAEQADRILNRCIDEFDKFKSNADNAQDKLSKIETEAQVYVAKAVPFANEADIQKALQEFWADPKRIQAQAESEKAVMASLNAASRLSDIADAAGPFSGKAEKAQKHLDDFIVNPSIMRGVGSSEAAKAFIAQRQFAPNAARQELFSPAQLERAIGSIGDSDKQKTARSSWYELLKGVSSGQAISSKSKGSFQDAADAVVRLKDYKNVFAKGDDNFDQAVEGMRRAALAKTEEEAVAVLEFWAGEFNIASNLSKEVGANAKPVALPGFSTNTVAALSVVGTAIDVMKLYEDPSVANLAGTSADAAQMVNNTQMAFRSLTKATEDQLLKRGTWINGAGAIVSTIDFLGDDSGNGTIKALKGVNAAGAWMVFASGFGEAGTVLAAAGPAGIAIGLLSTLAICQYSRVSASNEYETPAATAFIHAATGLDVRGGKPIAYQLRNDDSHGVNHNEVIYLAVAQHLGIQADGSAQSKADVVKFLNALDNDAVGRLADVAARIGYKEVTPGGRDDADGNGQLYAATSKNDQRQIPQPSNTSPPPMPQSVTGLVMWIERELT